MSVLLLLSGCLVTAEIVDPDTLSSDTDVNQSDTEESPSDDPGDDPTDTEPPTDTEEEIDPTAFLIWRGTRAFDFESGCEDEVDEFGYNVIGESGFEDLEGACPRCDAIFTLTASPDRICDGYVGISTEPVRGLVFEDDGDVTIYAISEDYRGDYETTELATGVLDGTAMTYSYSSSYYGYDYDVEGSVEFE